MNSSRIILKQLSSSFSSSKGPTHERKIYGPLLSEYQSAKNSCVYILDAYRKKENKSSNNTIIILIVENESFTDDKHRVAEIIIMLRLGIP